MNSFIAQSGDSKHRGTAHGSWYFWKLLQLPLWLRDSWELWCRKCHGEQKQKKTVEDKFKEKPRGQILANGIGYRELKV